MTITNGLERLERGAIVRVQNGTIMAREKIEFKTKI